MDAMRKKATQTRSNMIARCHNPTANRYISYGGRGITVCERWRDSLGAFIQDMGLPPSAAHSIDRIDNDRGYEPGNCRWATREEQMANRRHGHRTSAPLEIDDIIADVHVRPANNVAPAWHAEAIAAGWQPPKRDRRGRPLGPGPVAKLVGATGISMADIASKVGVNYETVKKWNSRGRVPSIYAEAIKAAVQS